MSLSLDKHIEEGVQIRQLRVEEICGKKAEFLSPDILATDLLLLDSRGIEDAFLSIFKKLQEIKEPSYHLLIGICQSQIYSAENLTEKSGLVKLEGNLQMDQLIQAIKEVISRRAPLALDLSDLKMVLGARVAVATLATRRSLDYVMVKTYEPREGGQVAGLLLIFLMHNEQKINTAQQVSQELHQLCGNVPTYYGVVKI